MLEIRAQNDLPTLVPKEDDQLRTLFIEVRDKQDQMLQENKTLRMELANKDEQRWTEITKPFWLDKEESCQVITLRSGK